VARRFLRRDVDAFLAEHGLARSDVGVWVSHPGGPKVLEAMEEALELPDDALEASWRTLREVGNLSSTSVLLVLRDVMERRDPAPGTWGLMVRWAPASARSWCSYAGDRMDSRVAYTMLVALVALLRLVELEVSRRNVAALKARGGVEAGAGVYPWIVLTQAFWLVSSPLEVWLLDRPWVSALGLPMLVLFAAGMGLRYWAVHTLGPRWSTRVVFVPGEPLVKSGPYRLLRHPNYLGMVLELIALPLVHTAWITAVVATAANALALRRRIDQEAALEDAPGDQDSARQIRTDNEIAGGTWSGAGTWAVESFCRRRRFMARNDGNTRPRTMNHMKISQIGLDGMKRANASRPCHHGRQVDRTRRGQGMCCAGRTRSSDGKLWIPIG
jgi:methyltransferase